MDKRIDLPPVLGLKEAAEYLNVAVSTMYRLAVKGKVPSFRVGAGWRFSIKSLEQWRFAQERREHTFRQWRH